MSKPIFVDPVLDGAADPTVIWNAGRREWWMFYTNRRAHLDREGAGWIHGSPIGIATSPDGWTWTYRGVAEGLDPVDTGTLNTHWAPEVISANGEYHMWLTFTEGAPDSFAKVQRRILHLTSPDLETWTHHGAIPLSSGNVIDACVALCPDGYWRLWFKDEAQGSGTHVATSRDLSEWTYDREIIPGGESGGRAHEGPNVFTLSGHHWMIVDEWRGQAVYRSADMIAWEPQGLLLDAPGSDPMDRCFARHADVVVQGDWAAIYYFTHPEWDEAATPRPATGQARRTVIHAARAWVEDGVLKATRDVEPFALTPPA
jgi:sucrose-6-phosphate hydrolase SacC (GH32 family)